MAAQRPELKSNLYIVLLRIGGGRGSGEGNAAHVRCGDFSLSLDSQVICRHARTFKSTLEADHSKQTLCLDLYHYWLRQESSINANVCFSQSEPKILHLDCVYVM